MSNNVVFVFGSNLAGRHGKGAAYHAMKEWGAEYGVGVGPTGRAYAIPTKDSNLKTLELHTIESYVKKFLEYAEENPQLFFIFTAIGTGLAGYEARDVARRLKAYKMPENVYVSGKLWEAVL